ncbi:MAG TPA: UbiA family prenyltransferase [Micromonosporaceae bacterium]
MPITTLRNLLGACHPLPSAAVTIGTGLFAVAAGHRGTRLAIVVLAVLAGQLSIGWANDWLDAPRDRAVGRTDKPVATGVLAERTVMAAALTAAAVTTGLSLWLGLLPGLLHVTAVTAGWLYNHPLKTTVASVIPYLVGFGLLPGFVVTALPGQPVPPWWLLAAAGLLGAGAHFANALPDLAEDARTGVRGLPQRAGPAASRGLTVVLLLAAGAVLVFGPPGAPSWGGVLILAGSVFALTTASLTGHRYGERALFRVVIGVALADVALLMASPL